MSSPITAVASCMPALLTTFYNNWSQSGESMRSTGESRGRPWVYTDRCSLFSQRGARPTDGATGQKYGKDFRRPTEQVRSSLYSCLV